MSVTPAKSVARDGGRWAWGVFKGLHGQVVPVGPGRCCCVGARERLKAESAGALGCFPVYDHDRILDAPELRKVPRSLHVLTSLARPLTSLTLSKS